MSARLGIARAVHECAHTQAEVFRDSFPGSFWPLPNVRRMGFDSRFPTPESRRSTHHANEGIAQGKYQGQVGVTLPKL